MIEVSRMWQSIVGVGVKVFELTLGCRETRRKLSRCWQSLRTEMARCVEMAQIYKKSNVKPPNYTLPTQAFERYHKVILVEADVDEATRLAVDSFYTEVQSLNRGIGYAHDAAVSQDDYRLNVEWERNLLKAQHILEKFAAADAAVVSQITHQAKYA